MGPTLEQVKDAAILQGVPTDQAEQFWLHYEAQDWKRANDQPVKNWRALLTLWCRDVYGMQKVTKGKLRPITNKFCSVRGCGMPAVYRRSGAYDNYYCSEHMPDKVKEKYE